MRRFVIESNAQRFEERLRVETDPGLAARIGDLLAASRRELALLITSEEGVRPPAWRPRDKSASSLDAAALAAQIQASPVATILLDPGPGLKILEVNEPLCRFAWTTREELLGRSLFEAFPENPENSQADGVSKLTLSLQTAAETGRPNEMAPQRYDVRDSHGTFVARYWRPVNTPLFNGQGRLLYILHEVEEVADPQV